LAHTKSAVQPHAWVDVQPQSPAHVAVQPQSLPQVTPQS
jgi:hypothetical protein